MDVFRLREIAEFGLGNALLALLVVPLSTTTGDLPTTLRICGVLGAVIVVGGRLMLIRDTVDSASRATRAGMPSPPSSTSGRSRPGRDRGQRCDWLLRVGAALLARAADACVRARACVGSACV